MTSITVDTPSNVTQCGPVTVQWLASGTPSYTVSVLNAQNSFNEPTIATLGNSFDPFLSVNKFPVLANTLVVFQVSDQGGNSGKSSLVSVASSNDFSCLPPDEQPPPTKTAPTQSSQPPPSSPPASPSNGQSSTQSSASHSSTNGLSSGTGKATVPGSNTQSVTGSATVSGANSLSSGLPETVDTGSGNTGGDPTDRSDPGSPSPTGNLSAPPSNGLSPGVLAAIGGGAVVVVIIILAIWLWRRGRRRSQEAMDDWFNLPQHTTQSYDPGETSMRSGGGGSAYSMNEYGGAAAAAVAPASGQEYYHDRPPAVVPGPYTEEPMEEYGERPLAPHEYYDSDPKQRRVMRASTYFSDETAGVAKRQRTSSSISRTRSATGTTEVPTNLSPEEMARLADLVASRMRTAPRADEPPPMYS